MKEKAAWKKKRTGNLTQGMVNFTVLFLLAVIAVVLVYSNRQLNRAIKSEQYAISRKETCEKLGRTVSEASDYLTEEARKYIITGEKEHLDNYWREVYEENRRSQAIRELKKMKLGTDITMLLELAKTVSDELIYTEAEAMFLKACSLGSKPDDVLMAYLTEEKRKQLLELSQDDQNMKSMLILFDENYTKKKEIIYAYISDFQMLMTQKLDREVRIAREATNHAIWMGNLFQGIIIFLVIFMAAIIYGAFIRPVMYYERLLKNNEEEWLKPCGISEIYDLGATILAMYGRMKKALQAKSDFLAVMSHEIRTPLHSMLGYCFLLEKTDLNEQQRNYVRYLQDSTENLMQIVNQILDYSRLNSYKFEIEESEFSIFCLAEEIENAFLPLCQKKGLKFKVHLDSDNYEYFLGDYTKIRQILNNLVHNAVKFTQKGSVKVFLKLWERETDTVLSMQVEDSGIGIRPEDQEKIFSSFEQADKTITRRFGGTGLGLPICKKMAQLLGGDISVRSRQNGGSLFLVNIPVKIQEDQRKLKKDSVQIEWQFPDLHVLLVEDHEVNGRMQKEILEMFQVKVDYVLNGKEAVSCAHEKKYDLVLMDIRMPDMDGYQAAALIREEGRSQGAVIMALTADVQESVQDRAGAAGMQEVLLKPLKVSVIQKKLNQYFSYQRKPVEILERMPDDGIRILEENKKLYDNLVTLFVKNHEWDFRELIRQVEWKNRKEILDILHVLKGVTGTIGAFPMQKSITEMETAVVQKRITWGQLKEESRILYQRFLSMKEAAASLETEEMKQETQADVSKDAPENVKKWNETYEAFSVLLLENDFEAAELFRKNRRLFVEFLGEEAAEGLEGALGRFDYEAAEEYL